MARHASRPLQSLGPPLPASCSVRPFGSPWRMPSLSRSTLPQRLIRCQRADQTLIGLACGISFESGNSGLYFLRRLGLQNPCVTARGRMETLQGILNLANDAGPSLIPTSVTLAVLKHNSTDEISKRQLNDDRFADSCDEMFTHKTIRVSMRLK